MLLNPTTATGLAPSHRRSQIPPAMSAPHRALPTPLTWDTIESLSGSALSHHKRTAFEESPLKLKNQIFCYVPSNGDKDLFKVIGFEDGDSDGLFFKVLFVDCGTEYILVKQAELFSMLKESIWYT